MLRAVYLEADSMLRYRPSSMSVLAVSRPVREDISNRHPEEHRKGLPFPLERPDEASLEPRYPRGVDRSAGANVAEAESPDDPQQPERSRCVVHERILDARLPYRKNCTRFF